MIKYLLLFFFTLLSAQDYPVFSKQELEQINQTSAISKNRILDYKKNMGIFQKYPKDKQLQKINFYLNGLLPQYDDITKHKQDDWATPKDFLKIGYGDCEDYVIIKYYSLINLGFNEKKLFLTIVKENFHGGYHMVLSYFKKEGIAPLILDNLSFKILDLHKRKDLKAQYFINSTGVYTISKNFKLTKIAQKYKEFEELKLKVTNND